MTMTIFLVLILIINLRSLLLTEPAAKRGVYYRLAYMAITMYWLITSYKAFAVKNYLHSGLYFLIYSVGIAEFIKIESQWHPRFFSKTKKGDE